MAAVVAAQRLAEDRRFGCVAARIGIAAKRAQQGHKKNCCGDERGNRISRQSKDDHRPKPAMEYRFARPHRDLPKIQFHALPGKRRFDQIMIAYGRSSESHQNIGGGRAGGADMFFNCTQIIVGDAEVERLTARGLDERGNRVGIRGNDLIGANGLARTHQFVAGRENSHARAPGDCNLGEIHRGGERDVRRAKPRSGGKQNLALGEVDTLGANVTAPRHALQRFDETCFHAGIFLNQNRVAALRHRRAGENPHGFLRPKGTRKTMPGRAFADLFQLNRQLREIPGAHRVTVHGGDRLGGLSPLGGEIQSKCSSRRAFQGDDLDRAMLGNIR